MNCAPIPPELVHQAWPVVSHGLDGVLSHSMGLFDADEIRDRCASGEWLLLVVLDDAGERCATFICSIAEGERKLFEVGMAWGTAMNTWFDRVSTDLEIIARQMGCDQVVITGRRGWSRYLKAHGFREQSIIMVKDL